MKKQFKIHVKKKSRSLFGFDKVEDSKDKDFPICSIRLCVIYIPRKPMTNNHVENGKHRLKEIDSHYGKKSFLLQLCCRHYLGAISSHQTIILSPILSFFPCEKLKRRSITMQTALCVSLCIFRVIALFECLN